MLIDFSQLLLSYITNVSGEQVAKDLVKYRDIYNRVFDSLARENTFDSLLCREFSHSKFNNKQASYVINVMD